MHIAAVIAFAIGIGLLVYWYQQPASKARYLGPRLAPQ
jgi:hypothetical protein